MDARKFDEKGKTICPECGKHFEPILGERDPYRKIQDQFPNAKLWEREQLVSGICSQKCWSEHLGMPEGPDVGRQLNNQEREQWIDNDEGLYDWWKSSYMSKRDFIKVNRTEIDAAINNVLGGTKPAHYMKYGRAGRQQPTKGFRILAIYDYPDFADRYSIYVDKKHDYQGRLYMVLCLSDNCNQPNGVNMWGSGELGDHNGKKITFEQLPPQVQKCAHTRLEDDAGTVKPERKGKAYLLGDRNEEIDLDKYGAVIHAPRKAESPKYTVMGKVYQNFPGSSRATPMFRGEEVEIGNIETVNGATQGKTIGKKYGGYWVVKDNGRWILFRK